MLALFVWAGLVAGISFIGAPLEFTAPHITVALGLGIGRIVFAALNKVKLVLATLACCCAFYLRVPLSVGTALGLLGAVLLLQTFWLLPALDARPGPAGWPPTPAH